MNILTYNTLFRGDMDLKPVPELVDTYENTSDTEWVFHLRQGVKFHDGTDFKADCVIFALDRVMNPDFEYYLSLIHI